MAQICWICGFKIDDREYEDVVYTRAGMVHGYCLEFYPMEVGENEKDRILFSE